MRRAGFHPIPTDPMEEDMVILDLTIEIPPPSIREKVSPSIVNLRNTRTITIDDEPSPSNPTDTMLIDLAKEDDEMEEKERRSAGIKGSRPSSTSHLSRRMESSIPFQRNTTRIGTIPCSGYVIEFPPRPLPSSSDKGSRESSPSSRGPASSSSVSGSLNHVAHLDEPSSSRSMFPDILSRSSLPILNSSNPSPSADKTPPSSRPHRSDLALSSPSSSSSPSHYRSSSSFPIPIASSSSSSSVPTSAHAPPFTSTPPIPSHAASPDRNGIPSLASSLDGRRSYERIRKEADRGEKLRAGAEVGGRSIEKRAPPRYLDNHAHPSLEPQTESHLREMMVRARVRIEENNGIERMRIEEKNGIERTGTRESDRMERLRRFEEEEYRKRTTLEMLRRNEIHAIHVNEFLPRKRSEGMEIARKRSEGMKIATIAKDMEIKRREEERDMIRRREEERETRRIEEEREIRKMEEERKRDMIRRRDEELEIRMREEERDMIKRMNDEARRKRMMHEEATKRRAAEDIERRREENARKKKERAQLSAKKSSDKEEKSLARSEARKRLDAKKKEWQRMCVLDMIRRYKERKESERSYLTGIAEEIEREMTRRGGYEDEGGTAFVENLVIHDAAIGIVRNLVTDQGEGSTYTDSTQNEDPRSIPSSPYDQSQMDEVLDFIEEDLRRLRGRG